MRLIKTLMAVAFGSTILAGTAQAEDGSWGGPLTGVALFQKTFGGAGLLTKWSSNETYGITQARINLELSQYSMAAATGVSTGYRDDLNQVILPLSVLYGLPDGRSFLAVSGVMTSEHGRKNPTYGDVSIGSATVEYLHMPTDNLAWGIGVTAEAIDTDLNANSATVNSYLAGLRADILYKANEHFAIASRVVALNGRAKTMVPLGFAELKSDQDFTRLYWQTDFVGTFSNKDFGFIGDGWLVHPTVTTVLQRTQRQNTTNSLGAAVIPDTINYALVGASVRVEKPVFGPGAWSPQFELGLEHEFDNTYGDLTGEENYVATKIGFGRRFGSSSFVNLAYGREDGFKGKRRQQALTVVYSMTF
ncbi:MAG TPA: hypothetical protein VGC31_10185 [Paenirhodobacter sp.]